MQGPRMLRCNTWREHVLCDGDSVSAGMSGGLCGDRGNAFSSGCDERGAGGAMVGVLGCRDTAVRCGCSAGDSAAVYGGGDLRCEGGWSAADGEGDRVWKSVDGTFGDLQCLS